MSIVNNGASLFRKLFIDFRHFRVLLFFVIEHIWKPWNHGKFSEAHFIGIKANYLILSTLLGILYVQDVSAVQGYQLAFTTIYCYLESGFSGY